MRVQDATSAFSLQDSKVTVATRWTGWAFLLMTLAASGVVSGPGPAPVAPASPAAKGAPRRPDIVLVVLDTLRRDATGLAADAGSAQRRWPGITGGLTPNLDRLSERAAVFTNAFSTSPWTAPAHASIFTGLLPSEHLCGAGRPRLDPAIPTLAEILAGAGYETAAFYSNPWLADEATGVLRGFQTKVAAPIGNLRQLTSTDGDQGGGQTIRNVASWLERRERTRPCFLFVNFLEPHLPYDPPRRIRAAFSPPLPATGAASITWAHEYNAGLHPDERADWPAVRGLYAGDVRFTDELLGRLLDAVRTGGSFDETAIAVTSDHGENLGDHGLAEHQFSIHESLLAVPLVVKLPGRALPPGRNLRPVMTSDLFATLASVGGAKPATSSRSSVSLADGGKGDPDRPLFAEDARPHRQLMALLHELNPARDFTAFDQSWRTVRVGSTRLTIGSRGALRLHDLATDPREERDLAAARRPTVERLGQLLNTLPVSPPAAPEDHPMDEETRRRLRTLGYID